MSGEIEQIVAENLLRGEEEAPQPAFSANLDPENLSKLLQGGNLEHPDMDLRHESDTHSPGGDK